MYINGIESEAIGLPDEIEIDERKEEILGCRDQDLTTDNQHLMWQQLIDYKQSLLSVSDPKLVTKPLFSVEVGRRRLIPVTDRSLLHVAIAHDLTAQELQQQLDGARVLDVGVGNSTFANEVEDLGINCQIISIDQFRDAFKYTRGHALNVYSTAEDLAFQDESFDRVYFTYSLPLWAMNIHQINRSINSALRVLRKGGSIQIAPLTGIPERTSLVGGNINSQSEFNAGSFPEQDPEITEFLREVQIGFIDFLTELNRNPSVKLILGRQYLQEIYDEPEELQTEPPNTLSIVKL